MIFYKHYIGDFQRDTGELSLTERGAYLSLIHHYYATEKPLPNNLDALCRIAGAINSSERKAVKAVMCFFEVVESGLMHARIESEIQKAGETSNTNRDIALAREAKRRAEREAKALNENSTNRANSVPRNEHENSTNHTPDTRHHINQEQIHTVENCNSFQVSTVASVCIAIKHEFDLQNKQCTDISQTNPTLIALIEAGASPQEFAEAAKIAAGKGKGFGYLIGTVKRQREEAAGLKLHQGAMPTAVSSYQQGIASAAKSIFTDANTGHLQPKFKIIGVEDEPRAIAG